MGEWGIEKVISIQDIDMVCKEVTYLISQNNNSLTLAEIAIQKDHDSYSELLKKCLHLIENMYVSIMKVSTLSEMLDVSDSVLTREFQRFQLLPPKKILLILKVKHAEKLMTNDGLNMNEVAKLSGFSNIKRMTECFHRVFGHSPGSHKMSLNARKLQHDLSL